MKLQVTLSFVISFSTSLDRNPSDVFLDLSGIEGTGLLTCLDTDTPEMKFEQALPFFHEEFFQKVYKFLSHILTCK
jgi:hypothetical protein